MKSKPDYSVHGPFNHSGWPRYFSAYEMDVLVHGQSVKEYTHHDDKTYIEGRRGSEFTLRVRNNTPERVLAVVSVDGLSVMDGKTASFDSGGYVISPYGYVDIKGWRLDNHDVARFFFSHLEVSYAAKMDKPQNVGVIGCAVFKEKVKAPDIYYYLFGSNIKEKSHNNVYDSPTRGLGSDAFSTKTLGKEKSHNNVYDSPTRGFGGDMSSIKSLGAGPSRSIGTGFGERQRHEVQAVSFDRENSPVATLEIHYAEREDLLRYGVNLHPRSEVSTPKPFPGETGCTPPPGWRG